MSKETYLQLKKEFWMRLAFNVEIAGIGLVLLIVMIFNQSRYIPYLLVVVGMISLMNQVLVMPTKAKKVACEKEHPEWRELSVKGIKVDSKEQSKRYGVSLIALIVVIGAFFAMYRTTLQAAKRTRGESGNPAEVTACHGEHPKARTKLKRSGPVSDEGPTANTELQLRNRSDKWGVISLIDS